MRKFLVTCLLMALISPVTMAKQKTVRLRIIETSDVHGSFFPYDFITRKPKAGSIARVSSYVDSIRKLPDTEVILLDNGDILQGQPTCYYYNYIDTKSENIAASVVNYLGYDAESIGNHDIETGHAVYDKWIKEVKCPVIGANIIDTKSGQPYVKPYTIIERRGVRVAVLGMITPAIPNWLTADIWQGLRFDEMTATARHWVKYIEEHEHPDVMVGLFHSGASGGITTPEYSEDASLQVAREVPGFDLILFGHDHTRHNQTETNAEGHKVVCLDPANNAITVADAEINLVYTKGKWQIDGDIKGKLADVTQMPVDEKYMAHFQPQIDSVNHFVNRRIGEFASTISTRDCFFGSSAFNDLILNLQLQLTGADISFNAPLQWDATIKKGPVYVGDMFNLYKFENQLYVMRMTGEEIRKHLEMSYDLWVNTMKSPDDHLLLLDERTVGDQQRLGFKNFSFNFDSAAGIDYIVDVTKPDGEKVKILGMTDGRKFDEKAWYKVALNSYRGNGGGELLTKGAGIPKDSLDSRIIYRSERDQRYYLMQEIEREGTVYPKANGNWKFVPEAWTIPAAKRDYELLYGKRL